MPQFNVYYSPLGLPLIECDETGRIIGLIVLAPEGATSISFAAGFAVCVRLLSVDRVQKLGPMVKLSDVYLEFGQVPIVDWGPVPTRVLPTWLLSIKAGTKSKDMPPEFMAWFPYLVVAYVAGLVTTEQCQAVLCPSFLLESFPTF